MSSSESVLAGSDDSFAFLCFGFVTSLLALAWTPSMLSFVWDMRSLDRFMGNLTAFWEWATFLPRLGFACVLRPGLPIAAASALAARRRFSARIATPYAVWRILRPRVVLLILFFILLPIVLYQKLSFDPHEILQLPKDADEKQIKKHYRRLSMQFHPDKNRTEGAKVEYARVRRAYKMLADPQAFEEELASQTTGATEVSVALPRFLLDPKYRRIAAPMLLGTLFLFPIGLIWLLSSSETDEALRRAIDRLVWVGDEYRYFYSLMGEPEDITTAKADEVASHWKVDRNQYAVANECVLMCTEDVTNTLNAVFPVIRNNKHYVHTFQQFRALHQAKYESLTGAYTSWSAGERPAKSVIANLQTINKRLAATIDALQPTDSRLHNVEAPEADDLAAIAPQPRGGAKPRGGRRG